TFMVLEKLEVLNNIKGRHKKSLDKDILPEFDLSTKPISNFYRSPDMGDSVEFSIDFEALTEKIRQLKEKIKKSNAISFHNKFTLTEKQQQQDPPNNHTSLHSKKQEHGHHEKPPEDKLSELKAALGLLIGRNLLYCTNECLKRHLCRHCKYIVSPSDLKSALSTSEATQKLHLESCKDDVKISVILIR
ncbi:hypothetical protein Tco_0413442, partial [Tanacetum coccineum]